jgi:hypothetical protein
MPMPKYDETQNEYHHCINPNVAAVYVIPKTNADYEKSGYIIDALAAESKNELTPAYYETTLKYRDLRDDESGEMLDLVFSNVVYDLGIIYDFGGVSSMITDMMKNNSTDVVSTYEAKKDAIQEAIDTCVESYS